MRVTSRHIQALERHVMESVNIERRSKNLNGLAPKSHALGSPGQKKVCHPRKILDGRNHLDDALKRGLKRLDYRPNVTGEEENLEAVTGEDEEAV